jgi:Uma2 family endonuclease
LLSQRSARRIGYPRTMQATLVPVEEYLRTNYDPDCEYVDGQIVERNLGEKPHSRIQVAIVLYLGPRAKRLGIEVLTEQRVQVSPTRYRIPDVAVLPISDERIVTSPPFICIEILSKKDTMEYMQGKIDDYLNFGVPFVWIINPRNKKAYVVTRAGMVEATSGKLETRDPAIKVPLSAIFE